MTNDTIEETTAVGSNPAGVAQEPHRNDSTSPDRTELRSVSGAGDGQADAPAEAGYLCLGCRQSPKEGHWFIAPENHGVGPNGEPCRNTGRRIPPVFELGDLPPAAAPPPVRRCTAQTLGAGNSPDDDGGDCGAVIAADLRCDVCVGNRCYSHCGGIDHFGGHTVDEGGSGALRWKVAEITAGHFQGQVWRSIQDPLGLKIFGTVAGKSRADVNASLRELLARFEAQHETERRADTWSAAVDATKGVLVRKRAELLREVIDWLRETETDWSEFEANMPTSALSLAAQEGKKLHDQQIADLFARLGAGL